MADTLTPAQRQWIEALSPLLGQASHTQAHLQKRTAIEEQVARELQVVKQEIQQGNDFAINLLNKSGKKSKKTIRTTGDNALQSFDTVADLHRVAQLDPQVYGDLMRAT